MPTLLCGHVPENNPGASEELLALFFVQLLKEPPVVVVIQAIGIGSVKPILPVTLVGF